MKPYCVTIQMKAIEQYFHVILFIVIYKVPFKSVDETLVCDHSSESYVPYATQDGSNFSFCAYNLLCDHLNESYWAVLLCWTVYYTVQGGSNFQSVDET